MRNCISTLVALVALGCIAAPSHAQEARQASVGAEAAPSARGLSKAEAGQAVRAFDAALAAARKVKDDHERARKQDAAVALLGSGAHEVVDARLVKAASNEKLAWSARAAALDLVAARGEAAAKQGKRLRKWFYAECEDEAEALRSGDIGVPVNPRTGDPETNSPAARRALREGRSRATLLLAGLRAVRALGEPKKTKDVAEAIAPLLQSPFDDLAIAAVKTAQEWNLREVSEEIGLLLRMYPRMNRWETGAVVHLGGTNASAKAAWMRLFGHPNKQRPRPELHRALLACASAWAGRKIESAEAYAQWMASAK